MNARPREWMLLQGGLDLVEPGTMHGEQANQLDLRFAKIFQLGEHGRF